MKVYKGEQCFVDKTQSLRIAALARKTLYTGNYRVNLPLSGQKSKTNLRSFIKEMAMKYLSKRKKTEFGITACYIGLYG